jgi:hypothetical protein
VTATGSYSLGQATTARADSSVLKNMKEEVVVWRIVCYVLHVFDVVQVSREESCVLTVCCCRVILYV